MQLLAGSLQRDACHDPKPSAGWLGDVARRWLCDWLAVSMAGSLYVTLAVGLAGSNDNAIRWLPMAGSAIHGLTLAGSKTMAALSLPQAGRCPAIKMAGDDVRRLILYNKCGLLLPLTPRPAKRPFAARFRFLRAFGLQAAFRTIGLSLFCTAFLSPLPALAFYFPACPYTSLPTGLRLAWRRLCFLDLPFLYGLFRGFARLRFPGLWEYLGEHLRFVNFKLK